MAGGFSRWFCSDDLVVHAKNTAFTALDNDALPLSSARVDAFVCREVVLALTGDGSAVPSLRGVQLALSLAQQLAAWEKVPQVSVLTWGAAAPIAVRGSSGAESGGAWGFARVLRLEQPSLHMRSIDLHRGVMRSMAAGWLAQISETEVGIGGNAQGHVARLRTCSTTPGGKRVVLGGSYAITGGLGGLGLCAAILVVGCGASSVILAARSGRVVRDGQGLQAQLRSLGTVATVLVYDVGVSSDTRALLNTCQRQLAGVLHAAGALDKGLLVSLEALKMPWIHSSKAVGAFRLHCGIATSPVKTCILFSSVSAGLGNVSQANYATANASLDACALARRSHGVAACSTQWPLVGGAGMGADAFAALEKRSMTAIGFAGISSEEYASRLEAQLMSCSSLAMSVQLTHRSDVRELLHDLVDASQPRFGELSSVHVASTLSTVAQAVPLAGPAVGSELAHSLASLELTAHLTFIEAAVLRIVHELTGQPASSLSAEAQLEDTGLDSIASIELVSRLCELSGMTLPPTLTFELPTTRAIAEHILENVTVTPPPSCAVGCDHPAQPNPTIRMDATAFAQSIAVKEAKPFDDAHPSLLLVREHRAISSERKPHLLLVHNIVGDSQAYAKLVTSALLDRRIFGLLHAAHLGLDPARGEAADMIDEYSLAITVSFTDHSPGFDVMGMSFGAILAHRLALQTRRLGTGPRNLLLLDPPPAVPITTAQGGLSHLVAAHTLLRFFGISDSRVAEGMSVMASLPQDSYAHIVAALTLDPTASPQQLLDRTFRNSRRLRALQQCRRAMHALARQIFEPFSSEVEDGTARIFMLRASERWRYWESVEFPGITDDAIDGYGPVHTQLTITGEHEEVCSRCAAGAVPEFTDALHLFLGSTATLAVQDLGKSRIAHLQYISSAQSKVIQPPRSVVRAVREAASAPPDFGSLDGAVRVSDDHPCLVLLRKVTSRSPSTASTATRARHSGDSHRFGTTERHCGCF